MSFYPAGQCTNECENVTPWCLRHGNLGNAKDWGRNWASHGEATGHTPLVGADACFQPGCDGAEAPNGHVGVVIAVSGNTFKLREMNGPAGPGRVDDRWCAVSSGVSFLYEHKPSSPVAPPPVHLEPFFVRIMKEATRGANIRQHPSTSAAILRTVRAGTGLNCVAWARGTAVRDLETGGLDSRWYEVAGGGWVASALVVGNAPGTHP